MRFPPFNKGTQQIVKYQATLAAKVGAITPPIGMPVVQAAMGFGTQGIHYDLESDGGTIKNLAVSAYDMAVDTNELVPEPVWQPVNIKLAPGEKLNFMGSSLTLGQEGQVFVLFGSDKIPGFPSLQYTYHTLTAVATGVPTALDPASLESNATRVRLVQSRGIDLNTMNLAFGGKSGPQTGAFPARHASALADIILPAEWQPCDIPVQGGDAIYSVDGTDVGATGTSDVIIGYEFR